MPELKPGPPGEGTLGDELGDGTGAAGVLLGAEEGSFTGSAGFGGCAGGAATDFSGLGGSGNGADFTGSADWTGGKAGVDAAGGCGCGG